MQHKGLTLRLIGLACVLAAGFSVSKVFAQEPLAEFFPPPEMGSEPVRKSLLRAEVRLKPSANPVTGLPLPTP